MNKRQLVTAIMFASILAAVLPFGRSFAQDIQLACDDFPNSTQDVRVGYYMGEGMGYLQSGELWEARYSFSCVVEDVDPNYIPGYMARAAVLARQREYEDAIADYTTVIGLDSGYTRAYNNRAIVYAAQLDYDLALDDLNRAISQDAAYPLPYHNRAVIYAIQGDYAAAIGDLNQVIDLTGIDAAVADLADPNRPADAPRPQFDLDHAQAYAVLGIVYSMQALDQYNNYLLLTGSQGDARVQSAAGSLESRVNFELRLDDGTWMLVADFSPAGP